MASNYSDFASKGATFVNVLVEGSTTMDQATQSQLKLWVSTLEKIPFTATLDATDPKTLKEWFTVERDQFIIVDLATMQFVDIFNADPQAALDELSTLLAQ